MAKRKAAADKAAETALAVQKKGELALASGYGEYENVGFENVDSSDLSIPFLTVMQSNSPEIKPESKGGFGLEIGQLFNTVTQEVFDGETGIGLIPATTKHEWVEWAPRDSGGGFVARYDCDDPLILEAKATQPFGKYKNGENNLVETYYIYGILYDVEELHSLGAAVISFWSGTCIQGGRNHELSPYRGERGCFSSHQPTRPAEGPTESNMILDFLGEACILIPAILAAMLPIFLPLRGW